MKMAWRTTRTRRKILISTQVAIPDEVAGGELTEDELEASVDDLRKRKVIAKQVADAFASSQGAQPCGIEFRASRAIDALLSP